MYIVRFVRVDSNPDEEYQYHNESAAMYHFSLFEDDDSGLYSLIDVVNILGSQEVEILSFCVSYGTLM